MILSDYHRYRLYEILPGLSVWLTLIIAIILSFTNPIAIIYFIIVFDTYWVLRVLYSSFYLVVAWFRLRKTQKIDWAKKISEEG
jgi:hypothetical protein